MIYAQVEVPSSSVFISTESYNARYDAGEDVDWHGQQIGWRRFVSWNPQQVNSHTHTVVWENAYQANGAERHPR